MPNSALKRRPRLAMTVQTRPVRRYRHRVGPGALRRLVADAHRSRYAVAGPWGYALECAGLRAAGHKRLAEAAFGLRSPRASPRLGVRNCSPNACVFWTRRGRNTGARPVLPRYHVRAHRGRKAKSALAARPSAVARRNPGSGWRYVSMDRGMFAAQIDTDSPRRRACVADAQPLELALIRLAGETMSASERAGYAAKALNNATRIVDLLGRSSEQVMTTPAGQSSATATCREIPARPCLREIGDSGTPALA